MKNKFLFISILFIIFIFYSVVVVISQKPKEHKVLKCIRADMFYVDFNDNSKIDEDELVKLNKIYTFSDELNDFSILNSEKLNIDILEFLRVGYLANRWAKDNLESKNVIVTSLIEDKTKKYKYANINFNGYDLSKFYLENGLAYVSTSIANPTNQSRRQIKANSFEVSKLNFVLLNLNSKIYHKLKCPHIHTMRHAKLMLLSDLKGYFPCDKNKSIMEKENNIPFVKSVLFEKDFSGFSLYFTNPLEFNVPDSKCSSKICKMLLKEINASKSSIDIALYGIGDIDKIYKALIAAKQRGVRIRSVVDYSNSMYEIYPKTKDFIHDFQAKTDKGESIMHNKFFIFDNKKVLSGSANLSSSGIGGYSANSIVLINNPIIAAYYKNEFEQMFDGKFSVYKNRIDKTCQDSFCIYFSPKDDIKKIIINKINSSKSEICVSAFYLTQREIIHALIAAKNRGVSVFIIQDAVGANNFKDRVKLLRDSGINLIVENWGGKNHEKTMLFDSSTLLIGSANFSNAALVKNDENVIVIESKEASEFYRKYFFYLFNSIDKKFLKLIPRAESKESGNSCHDGVDNNFDGKIDSQDDGCKLN